MDNVNVSLRLEVGKLGSVTQTPAYTSTVGVAPQLSAAGGTSLIEPGDPA